MKRYPFLFLLVVLLSSHLHSAFAQEARLTGRIEHCNSKDQLLLYVAGAVNEVPVELKGDGRFSIDVDVYEKTRATLFWKGRTNEDWTCLLWLQPDSTLNLTLGVKNSQPHVSFEGGNAALSTYYNLCYQTFERENLLDVSHLLQFGNFADCQKYIERVLQPIGNALMDLVPEDFPEDEEPPEPAFEDGDEEDEDVDESDEEEELPDRIELARIELDFRQAQAEFAFAVACEQAGRHMNDDEAFRARLDEFDYTDACQADAIAFQTAWRVMASPQQYAPLVDEAAQLKCLSTLVEDQTVRNAVADRIMQRFFLRVQMGEVNPVSPACRPLYDAFHAVSTSRVYDDFISTRIDIMEHPELYSEEAESEEENEEVDETHAE